MDVSFSVIVLVALLLRSRVSNRQPLPPSDLKNTGGGEDSEYERKFTDELKEF